MCFVEKQLKHLPSIFFLKNSKPIDLNLGGLED
jgi:hypothetical protein